MDETVFYPKTRHGKPFCQCLYEIENHLPRTKYCRTPCRDQIEILNQRKNDEEKKDSIRGNV